MANPTSILGLISASLTITLRAATIGKDLHTLTSKLKGANAKVRQLSVHISAIRIAARSLSSWLEDDAIGSEEVEDVKRDLLDVLLACCSLLSDLQDHVAKALSGADSVGFKGAITYIWDEEIIKETMETLHHQETALILILQTLEQLTRSEQRAKLQENVVMQTLTKAKRPASSIFGLRSDNRSSAQVSYASENSEKMDAIFTFDMEVMASTAYRNAFTSLLRRNMVRRDRKPPSADADRTSIVTVTALEVDQEEDDGLELVVDEAISATHKIDPAPKPALPPTPQPKIFTTISDIYSGSLGEKQSIERFKVSDNIVSTRSLRAQNAAQHASKEDKYVTFGGSFWVRALYAFDGDDKRSLSFEKNDMIEVITQLESGWWDGVVHGVRGWFPSNFCEVASKPSEFLDEKDEDEDEYTDDETMDEFKTEMDGENACWVPQVSPHGRLFYFNTLTGVSAQELPFRVHEDEPTYKLGHVRDAIFG